VQDLEVRDPPDLGLDLGKRFAADIPAFAVDPSDQHRLGQAGLLAKSPHDGSEDIPGRLHVPKSELVRDLLDGRVGSEFRTRFRAHRCAVRQPSSPSHPVS
jgi:hypothetical protein